MRNLGAIFRDKTMSILNKSPLQTKIFLVLGTFFGLCFVFLSPPMKAPDEPQHYYRSFEVSEFHFLSTKFEDGRYGYTLPDNVGSFGENFLSREEKHLPPDLNYIKNLDKQNYSGERRELRFENSAVYSPVGYIPSSLGLTVGKIVNFSLLKGYYIGRVLNLLSYLLLIALAISITPIFRWIFMSVALLPMSLFQAASFSPDAVTNGLACLAVGLFLYLMGQRKIYLKHLLLSLLVLVSLALTKQVYLLFFLSYIFIPRSKFSSTAWRNTWALLICTLPVIFSIVWLALSMDIGSKLTLMFQLGESVSAIDQLKFITAHPFSYLGTIVTTLLGQPSDYLLKGIFGLLGWATISLPIYVYIATAIGLVLAVLVDSDSKQELLVTYRLRVIMGVVGVLTLVGVCTSLYLSFTPVGSSLIHGLQGRYFIPILFLLLPLGVSNKFVLRVSQKRFAIVHTMLMCLILSASLITLAKNTYLLALL